ncbi:MAG: 2-oxoacid:acceptor oxidoreductase family protein, partial [Candidatus Thermoplasmatota archaeon]
RAAVLHDRTNAVLTEDYGPEKTGGWSRADVVVSRDEIGYPLVEHPDVLVALSQDGYLRFRKSPKPGALVLIDPDMVRPTEDEDAAVPLRIPARREGEAMGARVLANLFMVGAVVELTRVVTPESALKAIAQSTRGDAAQAKAAFERGRVLARGVTA